MSDLSSIADDFSYSEIKSKEKRKSYNISIKVGHSVPLSSLILISILWPFVKLSNLNQHYVTFYSALSSIFCLSYIFSAEAPFTFMIYFLLIYLGVISSDIEGIRMLNPNNSPMEILMYSRLHSGWEAANPISSIILKNRTKGNLILLGIFIVQWFAIYYAEIYLLEYLGYDIPTDFEDLFELSLGSQARACLYFMLFALAFKIRKSYLLMLKDVDGEQNLIHASRKELIAEKKFYPIKNFFQVLESKFYISSFLEKKFGVAVEHLVSF